MTFDYDGAVEPGGPAAVRNLGNAIVRKASVGPMDNNSYLITCVASGEQLLIDAAADVERLIALVNEGSEQARLGGIATTHTHGDHVQALARLAAYTGATCYVGRGDEPTLPLVAEPIRVLDDGDTIEVGALRLEVLALPGHTPGSIAIVLRDCAGGAHLFTGDSLFPGGVGNTDRDPQRFATLFEAVTGKLFGRFGDEAWVYPGHGRDTTLGAERPHLDEWRARGW